MRPIRQKSFRRMIAVCWAVLLMWGTAWADPPSFKSISLKEFKAKLNALASHSCFRKKKIAVEVYSMDRQKTLYSLRSDLPLLPASNMKLVTTATALNELGPNYRFKTKLFSESKPENEVLPGNLYIKGFGDPKLVSEQMWLLGNSVHNIPIKKIEGDIVADDSYFDQERRIKTWKKKYGPEPYNAPISALSFNFNTVTVYAKPGQKAGDRPDVLVDPGTDYITVTNGAVTTAASRKRRKLIVNRVDHKGYDEITLSGAIPVTETRYRYYLNITEPTRYTAKVFKDYLMANGVEVKGEVRQGLVPEKSRLLWTHESEPLSHILAGLNKFSNNFTAEQVLKTLGAERFGAPGTTEKGALVVSEYLRSLGFDAERFSIADGSGLSRKNRLTASQIVRLLVSMSNDWAVFPEFFSALAVMGVDGSVQDRLRRVPGAQGVRVKTGTLNGVSAISGYLQTREGERLVFSILMNDLRCSTARAMRTQDQIIKAALSLKKLP